MEHHGYSKSHSAPAMPLHLLEEINHRVINEYSEAIAFLALASKSSRSRIVRRDLMRASERLRAFADMHRALLPPRGAGDICLGDYLSLVCTTLLTASLAQTGVRLTLKVDDIWLSPGVAWRIGLIVAELVRNASRHGLAGRAGTIEIEIAEALDRISCQVTDNGSASPDTSPGRGRTLVEAIGTELGASIAWTFTPKGSSVRMELASG